MGWGDAWAGLSQQSFGLAVDSLRGMQQNKYQTQRDEAARIAEEKREKARRSYEERMQAQKMEFEKGLRAEDRMYRMKENKQQQSFQLARDAAQAEREANDPYRMSLVEESRARVEAMRSPATGVGSGSRSGRGSGLSSPRVPDSILKEASDKIIARADALQADQNLTREKALGQAYAEVQQEYGPEVARQIRPGLDAIQGQLLSGLGRAARFFNP